MEEFNDSHGIFREGFLDKKGGGKGGRRTWFIIILKKLIFLFKEKSMVYIDDR